MKKNFNNIFLFLLFFPVLLVFDLNPLTKDTVINPPPSPALLYPVTETVYLTGKNYLEFKWETDDFTRSFAFDFRLYKGYKISNSNLIHKANLPYNIGSIKIKAEMFEDNQVYSWTLRRTAFGGAKSERSFSSFRVIKK